MKTTKIINCIIVINLLVLLLSSIVYSKNRDNYTPLFPFVVNQVPLDANNINSWVINTGIFNQDY